MEWQTIFDCSPGLLEISRFIGGDGMEIRQCLNGDAERFIGLLRQLEHEWSSERLVPFDKKDWINQWIKKDNTVILLAEENNQSVGFICANGGNDPTSRRTAQMCVGVLPPYTGKGIGTKLFEKLEEWALQNEIHRLEMAVMQDNRSLLMLCNKVGFSIEGMKKESLYIDGRYVNEFYLAKLLPT